MSNDNFFEVNLYTHETNKFNTLNLFFTITIPFVKNKAAARSAIPYILESGYVDHLAKLNIKDALSNLYGAAIKIDTFKMGDNHVLSFYITVIDERFTRKSILKEVLILLNEMVFYPPIHNWCSFKKMLLDGQHKLHDKASTSFNNNFIYAFSRLTAEMYENEEYGGHVLGSLNEVQNLNYEDIKKTYEELLANAKFNLFVIGYTDSHVEDYVNSIFGVKKSLQKGNREKIKPWNDDIKMIEENSDLSQSILLLGYRIFSQPGDSDFETNKIINALLGKFPSSKLFANIREQRKIAYYIQSQLDINKGSLIISSIINKSDKREVINLIKKEIEKIKKGAFSKKELKIAKKLMINTLLSSLDTPMGIIDFYMQNKESTINTNNLIKKINEISRNDIISAVNKWQLDTIYFLQNKG